jgi:hypothetical protein
VWASRSLLSFLPALALASIRIQACPGVLDRSLTLRNPAPFLVEEQHGRLAAGQGDLSFALPDFGSKGCHETPDPALAWGDSSARIGALLVAGEEYRYQERGLWATEAGAIASGAKGPASFRIDTRMYMEAGGDPARPSFDRESIDEQSKEVTGSIDYRSYSRFRGDLTLDLPFGKISVARDAAHWGPGLFDNLMFSQSAVPFYQYVFSTRVGPLRVTSLYGDLVIGSDQANDPANRASRNLYAHRYELSLGRNWLLSVSEQLILYNISKPYLFAPVFPLFIAKGFLLEDSTNGNLGADVAWRSPWSTLFYAEFLLDDLESPTSLFTQDYAQNKWGAMAGIHWEIARGSRRMGAIFEASTLEPWVYAHFIPSTAQAANVGMPLGNPQGPDSRSLILKGYARWDAGLYVGVKAGLYWKGKGPGSNLNQPAPQDHLAPKETLLGAGRPDLAIEPDLDYAWKKWGAYLTARLASDPQVRVGIRAAY